MVIADLFPEAPPVAVDAVPDERYTTPTTMEWVKRIANVDAFDLDVAACAESHHARRYYTKEVDGLRQMWSAARIFCNPPYSDLRPWLEKAWYEITHGEAEVIAMLLPANRTEQPFWQQLVEPLRDGHGSHHHAKLSTHFVPSRVRYGYPGNPTGIGSGSPPFASVLLVWRLS